METRENLYKKIIPCLDIKDGKVCKGVGFENIQKVGDVLELAKKYEAQGADEITLLDITATNDGRKTFTELLKTVSKEIKIPIAIGGGVRELDDFARLFDAGAAKVSVNSAACKNPALLEKAAGRFGSSRIICAVDGAKNPDGSFSVMINGGNKDSGLELRSWAREIKNRGAGEILLTSKTKDGAKSGYDLEMTELVCDCSGLPVTASGGCGKLQDFLEVFRKTKAASALAASVFHYDELTVRKVKTYLKENGIKVKIDD